jgi:hypothetical protein
VTDRFRKRMKSQADKQAGEEDKKGKLTYRLGKRMTRQADRQVWNEDDKAR